MVAIFWSWNSLLWCETQKKKGANPDCPLPLPPPHQVLAVRSRAPWLTKQMCPDVACLRVEAEDASETSTEGGHGRPVPMEEEVIVLQPVRQHIIRHDTPAALPDLQREKRRRLCRHYWLKTQLGRSLFELQSELFWGKTHWNIELPFF